MTVIALTRAHQARETNRLSHLEANGRYNHQQSFHKAAPTRHECCVAKRPLSSNTLTHMFIPILAHKRICLKCALHRGAGIIRTEKLLVIFYKFRIICPGQYRKLDRGHIYHRMLITRSFIETIRIVRQISERDGIIT